MTAVSIVGQLIFVFNLAIFGGISGPGIYGAQYYGQRNEEGFRHTFRIKLWICLACVIIGTLIFMTSGETLISMYLKCADGCSAYHASGKRIYDDHVVYAAAF